MTQILNIYRGETVLQIPSVRILDNFFSLVLLILVGLTLLVLVVVRD
ncbi:hypothetical protein JW835_13205 [bacterium]|nr:hypothetical protein [bacterium]